MQGATRCTQTAIHVWCHGEQFPQIRNSRYTQHTLPLLRSVWHCYERAVCAWVSKAGLVAALAKDFTEPMKKRRKGERGKKTLCLCFEAFSLFNYFLSFYVSFSHIRDFHRKFDRITVIRMIFYSHLYVIALNCGKESTFKFIEYKT